MKMFDYDVFGQCFNIGSQDTGPFLQETVGSGADSCYIHNWPARLRLPIMQLSEKGYGPD